MVFKFNFDAMFQLLKNAANNIGKLQRTGTCWSVVTSNRGLKTFRTTSHLDESFSNMCKIKICFITFIQVSDSGNAC